MARTVAEIDADIEKLKQKIEEKKKKKTRLQNQEKAKQRKLENRVKFILGGWLLNYCDNNADFKNGLFTDTSLRDQDRQTLKEFFENR